MNNKQYIKPLKIKNVTIPNNLLLAPLAGITDYPFRLMCKIFGAGLTTSEMVNVTAIAYKSKLVPKLVYKSTIENPFSVQLFGNKPEHFKVSVRYLIENNICDIIDINMGCPAKQVVSSGSGCALMKNLNLAKEIIKATVETSNEYNDKSRPITLKMRLGWDFNSINATDYVKMAEDFGISMVTIHARTYTMKFSGKPLYEYVAKCKELVKIPVIVNGDICDYKTFKNAIDITNADGAMIGRASLGKVWIFYNILKEHNEQKIIDFKVNDIIKLIKLHARLAEAFDDQHKLISFRKQLLWYTKGWYNSAKLREKLSLVNSTSEIEEIFNEYISFINNK